MSTARPPRAILLMGPTASGKTAAALALAERFPLDLVSVDSALVYRDMDIGTAKPDRATLARHPHALIDLISPEESYSAARFCRDAHAAIDAAVARGRVPLLVGGTMLYYKALLGGLAELPEADAALRAELDAEAAARGWPALHAELARHDPETAARLAPNDAQRIQRALEVLRATGRPLSTLLRAAQAQQRPLETLSLALLPSDRGVLHARIAQRFDEMLAAGLEDELRRLRRQYRLRPELPSMRCVGYRQAWEAAEGMIPRHELRERGIVATRQLAKRQITWLGNSLDGERFDCLDARLAERLGERIAAWLG